MLVYFFNCTWQYVNEHDYLLETFEYVSKYVYLTDVGEPVDFDYEHCFISFNNLIFIRKMGHFLRKSKKYKNFNK